MDSTTLAQINDKFGPVYGLNLAAMPYPAHHKRVDIRRWVGKVYALLFTRFTEVLMLDSDSVPLADPAELFKDRMYQRYGNLFWPALRDDWVKDSVYDLLGLNVTLAKPILRAGCGGTHRDTESGQLLMNRARHMDAIQFIFWVNTFHKRLYGEYFWGDKDTFSLGFAAAGKAHLFTQVSVPMGGLFAHGDNVIRYKSNNTVADGWMFIGPVQHDNYGRPAFMHRTMNKYSLDEQPFTGVMMSAPISLRWAKQYFGIHPKDTIGPTYSAQTMFAAPDTAFFTIKVPSDATAQKDIHHKAHQPALRQTCQRGSWLLNCGDSPQLALPLDGAATGASCQANDGQSGNAIPPASNITVEHEQRMLKTITGLPSSIDVTLANRQTSECYQKHLVTEGCAVGRLPDLEVLKGPTGVSLPVTSQNAASNAATAATSSPIAPAVFIDSYAEKMSQALQSVKAAGQALLWLQHNQDMFPVLTVT
eukprot:jgi/Chrzof1/6091/Cz17g09110.t1